MSVGTDGYFSTQPTLYPDIIRWSLIGITFLAVIFLINGIRKGMGAAQLSEVMYEEPKPKPGTAALPTGEEDSEEDQPEALPENETPQLEEKKTRQLPQKKDYSVEEIRDFVELKPAEAAQVMRVILNSDEE